MGFQLLSASQDRRLQLCGHLLAASHANRLIYATVMFRRLSYDMPTQQERQRILRSCSVRVADH